MPHLTGEKWSLVDEDIMIMQTCGSCNYGGPSLVHMYNTTLAQLTQRCGYAMVTVTDTAGRDAGCPTCSAAITLRDTASGMPCLARSVEIPGSAIRLEYLRFGPDNPICLFDLTPENHQTSEPNAQRRTA